MRIILFLAVSMLAQALWARGFDSQIGASTRNYPLGARASVWTGYTQVLWAQDELPDKNPTVFASQPAWKYGYVRPVVSVDSSYFISRGLVEVELFPISIFGIAAGTSVASRGNFDFPDFDCDAIYCDGTLRKTHVRSQFAIGYAGVSFMLKNRIDWFRAGSATRPFIDDLSTLIANPGRDELRSTTAVVSYRIDQRWMTGIAADFQKFQNSGSHNQGTYLLVGGRYQAWRAMVGAGMYRSSHQEQEPSVFLDLRWIGERGPGLADD